MDVFFSPEQQKFFWLAGTGCTCCDSILDGATSLRDFKQGSAADVKSALRAFHTEFPAALNDAEMCLAFAKIKKVK